jgi:hypothetical protein
MHHERDQGNDQQEVNQAAGDVKREKSQHPHHE